MSMVAAVGRCHLRHRGRDDNFWLFLVERGMTAAAKIVSCPELNEQAVVATYDFPGIYRGESRGHLGLGAARAEALRRSRGRAPTSFVICGIEAVEVKVFLP